MILSIKTKDEKEEGAVLQVNKLSVFYRDRKVGELSMTPDDRCCAFQYSREWLLGGFSISPIDLPLKSDLFVAKPESYIGEDKIFPELDNLQKLLLLSSKLNVILKINLKIQ